MMKKWIAVFCILLGICFLAEGILPAGGPVAALAEKGKGTGEASVSTVNRESGEVKKRRLSENKDSRLNDWDEEYTMYNGQTLQLSVNTSKKVKWTSSKKSVATVNSKGLVTAKKIGTAYIMATYGSKVLIAKINVKSPVSISKSKITLKVGQEKSVTLTFKLSGYLTYSIADEDIVKATWESNWHGENIDLYIEGLKTGSTTVTVTNSVTKDKVKLKVTVKKSSSHTDDPVDEPTDEPPEESSKAKYRALLVGNSNYLYENDLPNHKWDVQAMKGLLTKSVTNPYSVTCKYDCTAGSILRGISSTFSGATDKDVSLFFYGGHGMYNTGDLCGVDNTTVSPAALRDALLKVPGKVIVILDCCYSGSMITNGVKAEDTNPADFNRAVVNAFSGYTIQDPEASDKNGELMSSKFIVLTACTKYEESWNYWYIGGNEDQSHSAFAKALFEGLGCKWSTGIYTGSAPCDTNKDGIASLGECQAYTYKRGAQINEERGHSAQHCMSYGPKDYKLFKLKK